MGEVVLDLGEKIACDLSNEVVETSRFVLVHQYRQSGGGLVEKILSKYEKEEISTITMGMREKRQGHRGKIFFIYGNNQKKTCRLGSKNRKGFVQKRCSGVYFAF
ncbi:hypothetical protein [Candidatus Neptunichlamydia sp. REUL1]|uniref:hypothetical protein n=1 Tax=Candidatus Neptunichlamydia sp. REUL1 TaxID=3064277 RepID=UPI002930F65E|nr:hypothetical protein [Candidatus Neptunochlamydia sp. REUL1]